MKTKPKNPHAVALGRLGGKTKTPAKRQSAAIANEIRWAKARLKSWRENP